MYNVDIIDIWIPLLLSLNVYVKFIVYVQVIYQHIMVKGRFEERNIHGLVQDWSNSSANALELLQSCTKPLIYAH